MDQAMTPRAQALYEEHCRAIAVRTDRTFAVLMLLQWAGAIAIAFSTSPRTWAGSYSQLHPHVFLAVLLGGLITLPPAILALTSSGATPNRFLIATCQMLMSGLLVHLTGGRLETHFHIFGSLAFLAMYRDWRVLIPATLIVAGDHFLRSVYWPQSIFGIASVAPWRWLEHAAWVAFEDIFLIKACLQSVSEMKDIALQRSQLESTNEVVEREVQQRTAELVASRQDLLAAKEAAEAANLAKSTFLTTISHEIRTPLNGILGLTHLVMESDISPDQRESLGLVKVSADSLLAVINDILDFSKIDAGELPHDTAPFSLRETLAPTMKTLAFRASQKGLALNCEVAREIPDALIGDATRLRQVLVNLVGNAIKFTAEGEVLLSVRLLSQTAGRAELRFSVQDTGIGVAPGKLQEIFEPFKQADQSTTREFGGTGLGLSISSRLVHLMGGRMDVESVPGKGSTFHFTARFEVQAGAACPAPPPHLSGQTALVADASATTRRILSDVLSGWGMHTVCADSARPALRALLASPPPFLILADRGLPIDGGVDLLQELEARPDWAAATVLTSTCAEQLNSGRRTAITRLLLKPVSCLELAAILSPGQRAAPPPGAPSPKVRAAAAAHTHRVLIAEDNFVNQRLACRLLEKRGYNVTLVDNGRAAVEALEREPFDLVLMDIDMPIMDGLEATAAIRALQQGTGLHTPIVAMTAHAFQSDKDDCEAAGMDGYVSKPVNVGQLDAVIRSVLPLAADD